MNYLDSCNIYFSTTYNLSFYDITYKNLVHTHPGINNEADKRELKQYIYTYIYYLGNTEIRRSVRKIKITYIRIPDPSKYMLLDILKRSKWNTY